MNRKIKFRLWVDGKMHYGRKACAVPEFTDAWGWTKRDKYVLQQFTGLLDKNGKDIYEGDIVKYYDETIPYEVYYLQRICRFSMRNGKESTKSFDGERTGVDRFIEVIGNVFENPELLK